MLVTVFLLILIDMTFAVPFCDTYRQNDYNIVVHSPDNQNLLFVVNGFDLSTDRYYSKSLQGFYWTLIETDSRLQFKRSDTMTDYQSYAFINISTLFSIGSLGISLRLKGHNETQLIYRLVGYLEVSLRFRLLV